MPYKERSRRLAYWKDYWKKNRVIKSSQQHRSALKLKYGLTPEDYSQMLVDQNFSCALCKKHMSKSKKRLTVDHCHETGRVRGLLCIRCNSALGQLGDTITSMKNVIEYLKNQGT